ncbi:MAG: hypothetical protein MUP90_05175 [Gammaproteobacteria bacterium]|nr:hypothetical protein [Gammaproteobacteria bacterium]
MNLLLQLAITIGAILVMLALWLAVQALMRRDLPSSAPDKDVLACRGCATHSCAGCGMDVKSGSESSP